MNRYKRRKISNNHKNNCIYCKNYLEELCKKKERTSCFINNSFEGLIPIPSDTSSKFLIKRSKIRRITHPVATFYFDTYISEKYESLFLILKKEESSKIHFITLISDFCYSSGIKLPSSYNEISHILKEDIRAEILELNKVLIFLRINWSEWIDNIYNNRCKICDCKGCSDKSYKDFKTGIRIPVVKSKVYSKDISEHLSISSVRHGLKVSSLSRYDALRNENVNGGLVERFYAPIIGEQLKLVHGFTPSYVVPSHPYLGGSTHSYDFIINVWTDTFEDINEILHFICKFPIGVANIITSYSIGEKNDIPFLKNVIIKHHNNRSTKLGKLLIKHKTFLSGYPKFHKDEIYPNISPSRIFEKSYLNRLNKLNNITGYNNIHCACGDDLLGLLLTSKLKRLSSLDNMMTSYISHWAFFSELIVSYNNDKQNNQQQMCSFMKCMINH